ncbi:MAG TPA: family 10 glycosylhydrolase [Verrucomicrobiae bacterium]
MKFRARILSALVLFLPAMLFAQNEIYLTAAITPPEPPREFRGAWIATVANIDWPSKPGLTVNRQKTELISLLDRAAQLHLNAVIFQVRPVCDAMYASSIEPWSEYLTGTQGKAPQPFYDPLAFAIAEAHKRGLELHAWFNPFRASHPLAKSPAALNHISRTHPELVRRYGDQLWLDPGEPTVRDYVLRVVIDVVKRYDVDGVQFDDYFYPYPEKDSAGRALDFPDYATWKKYGLPNGLERGDWRRQNVNQFIQSVYQNIKAAKPWVKFGISPFGIWRPQNPPQIRGLDAYATLYADSRKWLAEGWLDYFAPQLYWPADQREQSFPVLLKWWREQNVKGRNLWPGLSAANVGAKFSANEIVRQIQITRGQNVNGEIFYHLKNLTDNPALAEIIRNDYPQTALVPASPWLDSTPPDKPKLFATVEKSGVRVHWETDKEPGWLWVLQFRANGIWTTQILPANQTSRLLENSMPDAVSIRAVDRVGNLSASMVLSPQKFQKLEPARSGKIRPDLNWPPRK